MIIDIVFIVILIYFTVRGIRLGFLLSVLNLLKWFILIYYNNYLINILSKYIAIDMNSEYSLIIMYIITFIVFYIILSIAVIILNKIFKLVLGGMPINSIIGGVLGMLKGIVITFVSFIILTQVASINDRTRKEIESSYISPYYAKYSLEIIGLFPDVIGENMNKLINDIKKIEIKKEIFNTVKKKYVGE